MRKLSKERVYRHMGRGVPTKRKFSFWMDEVMRMTGDPQTYIEDTIKTWAARVQKGNPRTLFELRLQRADGMFSRSGDLVIIAEMIEKGERKRGTLPPSGTGTEGAWEW